MTLVYEDMQLDLDSRYRLMIRMEIKKKEKKPGIKTRACYQTARREQAQGSHRSNGIKDLGLLSFPYNLYRLLLIRAKLLKRETADNVSLVPVALPFKTVKLACLRCSVTNKYNVPKT